MHLELMEGKSWVDENTRSSEPCVGSGEVGVVGQGLLEDGGKQKLCLDFSYVWALVCNFRG